MKKNFKTMAIAGALVGVLTIGGVGTVAFATGNAYENYKSAAFQTMSEQNMTIISDITVKQDGAVIISGTNTTQTNGVNQYSSSKMQVNGETVETEQATVDGKTISRTGDKYTSMNLSGYMDNERDGERFNQSSSSTKLMSMVADLLVGDVKSHFTGSGNTVSVNLEGAQIPELLNVAASAMVEQNANRPARTSDEYAMFGDVFENLPISKDVKISRISLEGEIKDGNMGDNVITIVLTGKDSSGASHEIELICNAAISDIGSTTSTTIDTTGKTVTEATLDSYYRGR